MGVQGLWQLVQPTGRTVTLESLEGKVLAVDVSIWLHQYVKGMRDQQGGAHTNAHLIGIFTRVCKLLFYRIRPIFVFDGGVPSLKKQTLAARRQKKSSAAQSAGKATEKILKNYLKSRAIRTVLGGSTSSAPVLIPTKIRERDLYELPPMPTPKEVEIQHPNTVSWEERMEQRAMLREALLQAEYENLEDLDMESEEFKTLPPETQHEILTDVKEIQKRSAMYNREVLPEDSNDFSKYQMEKLMRQSKLSQKITDVRKEMDTRGGGEVMEQIIVRHTKQVVSSRVISEDSGRYVLVKGVNQSQAVSDLLYAKACAEAAAREEQEAKPSTSQQFDDFLGETASDDELRDISMEPDTSAGISFVLSSLGNNKEPKPSTSTAEIDNICDVDDEIDEHQRHLVEDFDTKAAIAASLASSGAGAHVGDNHDEMIQQICGAYENSIKKDKIIEIDLTEKKNEISVKKDKVIDIDLREEKKNEIEMVDLTDKEKVPTNNVVDREKNFSGMMEESSSPVVRTAYPPSRGGNDIKSIRNDILEKLRAEIRAKTQAQAAEEDIKISEEKKIKQGRNDILEQLRAEIKAKTQTQENTVEIDNEKNTKLGDSQLEMDDKGGKIRESVPNTSGDTESSIPQFTEVKGQDVIDTKSQIVQYAEVKGQEVIDKKSPMSQYAEVEGQDKGESVPVDGASGEDAFDGGFVRDDEHFRQLHRTKYETESEASNIPTTSNVPKTSHISDTSQNPNTNLNNDTRHIPKTSPTPTMSLSLDTSNTPGTSKDGNYMDAKTVLKTGGTLPFEEASEETLSDQKHAIECVASAPKNADVNMGPQPQPSENEAYSNKLPGIDRTSNELTSGGSNEKYTPRVPSSGQDEIEKPSFPSKVENRDMLSTEQSGKDGQSVGMELGDTVAPPIVRPELCTDEEEKRGDSSLPGSSAEKKRKHSMEMLEIQKRSKTETEDGTIVQPVSKDDSDDDFVKVANSSHTDEELSLSDASTPQQAVREKVRGLEDDYESSPKKLLLIEDDKEEDPLAITVVTGKSQTIGEEMVKEDKGKEDEVKEDPFTERQSPIMVLDDEEEEEMEEEAEDDEEDEDVEENEVERIPNEFEGMTQEDLVTLQSELAEEEGNLQQERGKQDRLATSITDQMNKDSMELLKLFGIPFVVAPTEAEAQCAFLDLTEQTEGTITNDSDIWLFGGKRVYKNFFLQDKYVEFYKAMDIKKQFTLDRQKLINLAILCGSDYSDGIRDVGPVTAMEILQEFPGEGLQQLQGFKKWWDKSQQEPPPSKDTKVKAKLRELVVKDGLVNPAVVEAYLKPVVDESEDAFSWGKPDLGLLRDYAKERLNWKKERVDDMLLPVLKRMNETHVQKRISNFFMPKFTEEVRTIKSKRIKRVLNRISTGTQDEQVAPRKKGKTMTSALDKAIQKAGAIAMRGRRKGPAAAAASVSRSTRGQGSRSGPVGLVKERVKLSESSSSGSESGEGTDEENGSGDAKGESDSDSDVVGKSGRKQSSDDSDSVAASGCDQSAKGQGHVGVASPKKSGMAQTSISSPGSSKNRGRGRGQGRGRGRGQGRGRGGPSASSRGQRGKRATKSAAAMRSSMVIPALSSESDSSD